jgi:rifampicin phosphotransferase
MSTQFPEIDIDPHPFFTVYSAGNLGEVAPQRLSPMSWSLVGTPMERGTRRLVRRVWGERAWAQGDHYAFLGYFACRPYHNLSAYSFLAEQLPKVAPEDVTAAYFEGVRPPGGTRGGDGWFGRIATLPRLVRELARLGPELRRLEEETALLENLARGGSGEAALTEVLLRSKEALDDAWAAHIVSTSSLVPLTVLQRSVNQRLLGRYGEVESWLNRPRELVWGRLHEFASPGNAGEFLDSSFYEVADDRLPWRTFAVRHRVLAEGTSIDEGLLDPAQAQWGMLAPRRRVLVQALARTIGESMASREHSKSLVMRLLHLHRRVLPGLAEFWRVDGELWPYLTIEEFRRIHREPGLAERAEPRRTACLEAINVPMPEHLDLTGGTPRAWAPDAPRTARGVSPGRVTGVAVHPDGDLPSGDLPCVLVCESADADVAPLLGFVGGVLTQRGSDMSHIAILAREHRIPAVVGSAAAREIKPGDIVTIDGSTGEVHAEP